MKSILWTTHETAKVTHYGQLAAAQGAKLFDDIKAEWKRIHAPVAATSPSVGMVRRLSDGTAAVCAQVTTGGAATATGRCNPDHD